MAEDLSVNQVSNQTNPIDLFGTTEVLGKDDFLNLLVTQLRYQDPLDPLDNTEFVAQLAQFSTLEQMQNMNTGIEDLSMLMQSVNNSLATQIIGKEVKYYSDTVNLNGEDAVQFNYLLSSKAESVTINVYNEDDDIVASLKQGGQLEGEKFVDWDGTGSNGTALPPGSYRFEINALDQNDEKIDTFSFSRDVVSGLKFEDGNAMLKIGEDEVNLSFVVEIFQQSSEE